MPVVDCLLHSGQPAILNAWCPVFINVQLASKCFADGETLYNHDVIKHRPHGQKGSKYSSHFQLKSDINSNEYIVIF